MGWPSAHLEARRSNQETCDAAQRIADISNQRVQLIQQRDAALNQRKEQSAIVGKLMQDENGSEQLLEAAKFLSTQATAAAEKLEEELNGLQNEMDNLLANIPNLLDDRVPDGIDEKENEVVLEWGDIKTLPAIKSQWSDDFEGTTTWPRTWSMETSWPKPPCKCRARDSLPSRETWRDSPCSLSTYIHRNNTAIPKFRCRTLSVGRHWKERVNYRNFKRTCLPLRHRRTRAMGRTHF